jgi:hypothetical protein
MDDVVNAAIATKRDAIRPNDPGHSKSVSECGGPSRSNLYMFYQKPPNERVAFGNVLSASVEPCVLRRY